MFRRMLVAVDDSDNSRRAVEVAKQLASGADPDVVLVHAYHVPAELAGLADHVATGDQYLDNIRTRLSERADTLLRRFKSQLGDSAERVELIAVEGEPGLSIVELARDRDCDCVVLGRRGGGRVKRLLLGSVSDYVAHHSKCPVVVVP